MQIIVLSHSTSGEKRSAHDKQEFAFANHSSISFYFRRGPILNDDVVFSLVAGTITYCISAFNWLFGIEGNSKLAQFVKKRTVSSCQVPCLPASYNGNIIFELPSKLRRWTQGCWSCRHGSRE